jgi:Uncharacterised protein conserved in bacteria (DUF2336)
MTAPPMFPGFDGLMTLSRREGVDIRPTLLRVLTDLYVQTRTHTADEERQFVELTSRLIDQVDDATRAAVRARLSIYPRTPPEIMSKLKLQRPAPDPRISVARSIAPAEPVPAVLVDLPTARQSQEIPTLSMEPKDASDISGMFFAANAGERVLILHNLANTPLKPSPKIHPMRAARAIETLEMAAFAVDVENFSTELSETLILPAKMAEQIVNDPSGEPLACAMKALGMPSAIFQRVLLFLNPAIGSSVMMVYRLSRLYDTLDERSVLIMLAAWRGSTMATTRTKYRPALHDAERHRARTTPAQGRPVVQPGENIPVRNALRNPSGD